MKYSRQQIAEARKIAKAEYGVNYLLAYNADPKTSKSNKLSKKFRTVILYMAPHSIGGFQACSSATPGCIASCLNTAGNPVYAKNKARARLARKKLFFLRRDVFKILLYAELQKYQQAAKSVGKRLAVRLNGTTDILWERVLPEIFTDWRTVQFYDYTKHLRRFGTDWNLPRNYDLTLSRSEQNDEDCRRILADNPRARVAIVFNTKRTKPLPAYYDGIHVDDADTHDMTFLRPYGWLGLRAKGDARKDASGFVVAS